MSPVASKILATINAPYSAGVSAWELAQCISSLDAMNKAYGPTFSFFTEVEAEAQHAFVEEMHLDANAVRAVALHLATKVPFPIALAA